MAYTDINTPVIQQITLPSGNSYYIADREIRDVVDALGDTIAGGVSFIVAWDGVSIPVAANIPAGVIVTYNSITTTGTLDADNATPGAFYLVKSATTTTGSSSDSYDEYVPVGSSGSKTWEKIGDTQIDLSDVVTGVSLTKQTDTVIGTDATFTVTQPTVTLASDNSSGDVTVATGIGSATTKYLSASASGGAVSASGDNVTALTGLGTPTTDSAVKSVSPTTAKLATTTVTGVSGSTTPSVVQGRTSQTTGTGTTTSSSTNTDIIKGMSVSNGVLSFGAATLNTQTTYSANAPETITVPTAASSATTVATGSTTSSGSGASVVTAVEVGDTINAVTGYSSPTTDTVFGTASSFNVTNPTITLTANTSSATGRVQYVQSQGAVTTTKLSATASGANTTWNSKDSVTVLKNTTDVNVTKGS